MLLWAGLPVAHALPEIGDREINVAFGAFMARGDASTGTAQLDAGWGMQLAPAWLAGLRQLFSYTFNEESVAEDVWTASTTAFINRYFHSREPFQPFLGAFLGLAYSDVDVTGTAGPALGARYFLNDRLALVGQYRYEAFFKRLDVGAETTDFQDGNHVLTLGLSYRLETAR